MVWILPYLWLATKSLKNQYSLLKMYLGQSIKRKKLSENENNGK